MAYKFDSIPSKGAYKEETADYWEIQALKEYGVPVSSLSILKLVAKEFDEIDNEGIESEEDRYSDALDDVLIHIKHRVQFTDNSYPFIIGKSSIQFNQLESTAEYLYVFLLLATRFNMKKKRKQDGIDGADLFELVCAHVAEKFFGENSTAMVFGTADKTGFQKKVSELIKALGEGDGFRNPNANPPTKNDDGIDVVVWKNFADGREGKLIGFGQCKTGTSTWRDEIHKLKPIAFCTKWFYKNPVFEPLALVFITDTMNDEYNFYDTQKDFLIFNRFRIMEYALKGLPLHLENSIKKWVDSAILEVKNVS